MATPRIRVAAIIVRDGRLLLVEHEKNGVRTWLLPGGGVDEGETLVAALQRELREELGVAVRVGPLAHVVEAIAPEWSRHMVQVAFHAEIESGEPEPKDDPRVVAAGWLQAETLRERHIHPAICDDLCAMLEDVPQETAGYLGNRWEP